MFNIWSVVQMRKDCVEVGLAHWEAEGMTTGEHFHGDVITV